jgi:hypothetical protein
LLYISFDELPSDERPPRRIWLDDDALQAHFDRVERDRTAKYGGEGAIEDPVDNDAAKLLIAE